MKKKLIKFLIFIITMSFFFKDIPKMFENCGILVSDRGRVFFITTISMMFFFLIAFWVISFFVNKFQKKDYKLFSLGVFIFICFNIFGYLFITPFLISKSNCFGMPNIYNESIIQKNQ